jgi:hypothetical protein
MFPHRITLQGTGPSRCLFHDHEYSERIPLSIICCKADIAFRDVAGGAARGALAGRDEVDLAGPEAHVELVRWRRRSRKNGDGVGDETKLMLPRPPRWPQHRDRRYE